MLLLHVEFTKSPYRGRGDIISMPFVLFLNAQWKIFIHETEYFMLILTLNSKVPFFMIHFIRFTEMKKDGAKWSFQTTAKAEEFAI